jgi:hypothetical protein
VLVFESRQIGHEHDYGAEAESPTILPSRISTRREAARATSSLCVTTIRVVKLSEPIFSRSRITAAAACESRFPVGSSAISNEGR